MASTLNIFFHSVFNPKGSESTFSPSTSPSITSMPELCSIQLTEIGVVGVLRNLNPQKASGPDKIPSRLLIELAEVLALSLCEIFNMSLDLGVVPLQWKVTNITPVFKREDPTLAKNYRPISLLCILSKVLERSVYTNIHTNISGPTFTNYNMVLWEENPQPPSYLKFTMEFSSQWQVEMRLM